MNSVDAVSRSLSYRLSLNQQISESDYWLLPVDSVGHENFMPVGRGRVSSSLCGTHLSFFVCDNLEGHKGKFLNGEDCTGMLVCAHEHMFCKKSSCPVCFIRGWSVREARSVAGRLEVASERGFGEVEHLTVSVALADRDLPEEVMRERSRVALLIRGFLGGCMIFHGFRKDKFRRVLVWSPHYHVLGFIRGGFDVCRSCVHERGDCASCGAFKGREVREYAKDGYLVKCFEKRKTVVGTAFYQLNHATVRVGIKRFHVVTWMGVCGYRMLKGRKLEAVQTCSVCKSEMARKSYWGREVRIERNIGSPEYRKVFLMAPFDSFGSPNFVDISGSRVK